MSFDKSMLFRALDSRVRGNTQQSREAIEELAAMSSTNVREATQAVNVIHRKLLQALKPASMNESSGEKYVTSRSRAYEICKKNLGITDMTVTISLCDRIIDDFLAQ